MPYRDTTRLPRRVLVTAGVLLGVGVLSGLVAPEAAEAALRSAAGGGDGGAGGFARFVRFINRLADYTIPIGSAFSVLGLIWGGMLFRPATRARAACSGSSRSASGSSCCPSRSPHDASATAGTRAPCRCSWRRRRGGRADRARDARAQIGLPLPPIPNPFDLGLPSPTDLIGKVFEFFFKTFFGIQAKVTQRAVEWLLAAPVYTDSRAYGDLNQLRSNIEVAGWALFTLVFTVSAVRYYASGLTSAGSYEAVEALTRGGVAAGALAVYPQVFGSLCDRDEPPDLRAHPRARRSRPGLTKLLGAARRWRASRRSASGRSRRSSPS